MMLNRSRYGNRAVARSHMERISHDDKAKNLGKRQRGMELKVRPEEDGEIKGKERGKKGLDVWCVLPSAHV